MDAKWILMSPVVALAAALALPATGSTSQSLNHTVTPGKLLSGPVRLGFGNAFISWNASTGQHRASGAPGRTMTISIEDLQEPALVSCDITWAEFEPTRTFEVKEFYGPDLAATGKSHSIFMNTNQDLQFIADPNPAGDYAYEIQFAKTPAQTLHSCTVKTL